jgi:hypothetical protein
MSAAFLKEGYNMKGPIPAETSVGFGLLAFRLPAIVAVNVHSTQ